MQGFSSEMDAPGCPSWKRSMACCLPAGGITTWFPTTNSHTNMHVCGDYNHEYIEITTSGNEALICVFHSNETFSFIITTSFSDLMAIIGQAVTTSPYTSATVICCFIQKLFQLQCLSLLVIIIHASHQVVRVYYPVKHPVQVLCSTYGVCTQDAHMGQETIHIFV